MGRVRDFISDNKVFIILGVLILSLAFFLYYKDYKKKDDVYNPSITDDKSYIKREYEANEYINLDVDLSDLLNEYYSYFIKKKVNNPKEAYKMLTKENQKLYKSEEEYQAYAKKTTTVKTLKNKVEEYRKGNGNNNSYDIIDTEGNKYTIIEYAVWDIEIIDAGK